MEGFTAAPSSTPLTSSSSPSSNPSPSLAKPYSHANPPPGFAALQALLAPDFAVGKPPHALCAFLTGGWRDVAADERWWEDVLGGDVEVRRRRNLEAIRGVRDGMEGALEAYSA
jgi:hypothetical protein